MSTTRKPDASGKNDIVTTRARYRSPCLYCSKHVEIGELVHVLPMGRLVHCVCDLTARKVAKQADAR